MELGSKPKKIAIFYLDSDIESAYSDDVGSSPLLVVKTECMEARAGKVVP